MTRSIKSNEEYATELFDLHSKQGFSLDFVLESARFDLKSEEVAALILVKEKLSAKH